MTTINAVELPTEADYQAAEQALQAAHDAVEALAIRLDCLDEAIAKPSRPATPADVGLLWSFATASGARSTS